MPRLLSTPLSAWPWHLRFSLYAGGIILSALLGGLVKDYLDRGQLTVRINSIAISSPTQEELLSQSFLASLRGSSSSPRFAPNAKLTQLAEESTWLPTYAEGPSITDYLSWLLEVQDTAERVARDMQGLRKRLSDWPRGTSPADLELIHRIIWEYDELIFAHVFGEVRRRNPIFSDGAPPTEGQTLHFELDSDEDGDYYVGAGLYRLPVVWSVHARTPNEQRTLRECARRFAHALAYGLVSDLGTIKAELQRMLQEETPIRDAKALADEEIGLYSRWRATVTVSNDGKRAVSLDPRIALYLLCKGQPFQDADRQPQVMATNMKVDMQRIATATRNIGLPTGLSLDLELTDLSREPIVVPGGTALSVSFWSRDRIISLDHGNELLFVFQGKGCESFVAALPLAAEGPFTKNDTLRSEAYAFQELNYESVFPADVEG